MVEEQRREQVGGHLGERVHDDGDVEVGLEVDDVEAEPVVHHGGEEVDEHGEDEAHPRGPRPEHVDDGSRGRGRRLGRARTTVLPLLLLLILVLVVELEREILRYGPAIGSRDGADDPQCVVGSSAHEVPPRRLGDERHDGDGEHEGGKGGDDVEHAPGAREERGDARERRDAAGEEVEGGHPRGAAAGGADGLGGQDEGQHADAARAEAREEPQRGVGPVVRGRRREQAESGVEDADHL